MLRFKGEDLRPILAEAATHRCRIVLVKDHGVYFLAENGEQTPQGHRKLLAFAVGCNPDLDPFDAWWERARTELGGDDFAEYFDRDSTVFARIANSQDDLAVSATATHITLQPIPADADERPCTP